MVKNLFCRELQGLGMQWCLVKAEVNQHRCDGHIAVEGSMNKRLLQFYGSRDHEKGKGLDVEKYP